MSAAPRLIHLNGPPGIGKTTLARHYVDHHPGALLCDVDVLRTMIGGWRDVPDAAERSRATALGMITAYLRTGEDVVLPQLVARTDQLARFATAASEGGGEHVHVMLTTDPETAVRRFRSRAAAAEDEWTAYATADWDAQGGDDALREWTTRLNRMSAVQVPSTDLESTYAALLVALGQGRVGRV
jgi:predicted kinase